MRKKGLFFLIGLFYFVMLLLTLCSRGVHEADLPKVKIFYPELYSAGSSDSFVSYPGIPEALWNSKLFLVKQEVKNGEIRYFAKEVKNAVFYEQREDIILIREGIPSFSMVVLTGAENVTDGSEVVVLNEEDIKAW